MEEVLLAHLLEDFDVLALVADRIAWGLRPRGEALPAIVLTRVSGRREYVMGGAAGLTDSLVQVDCWAGTYDDAKFTARAVVTALHTLSTSPISRAFVEAERDNSELGDGPRRDGSEAFHRTSLDVRVWHF